MDQLYKQAINLQSKFRQLTDEPNHRLAQQIGTEIQRLTDEIEMSKNPRTLEDRVKIIKRYLEEAENTTIMDTHHSNELQNMCVNLQQDLRKLM